MAVAYGLLMLAEACTTAPTTVLPASSIAPGTTSVSVDPDSFLGPVACSGQLGGMRSYVATVTDVTGTVVPGNVTPQPFVLPSSPPTSCAQSVFFEYVTPSNGITPGHAYTAHIDGYEQAAEELVPACSASGTPCASNADCPAARGSTCQNGVCSPPSCNVDSDCPLAYGCFGSCKASIAYDEDFTCLKGCGADPNLLMSSAYCTQKTTISDYLACLANANIDQTKCPLDPKNPPCLTNTFAAQQSCAGVPTDTSPETPPSGDQLVRGAVKACACTYVPVEGNRQMLDRATQQPVVPRWQTPPTMDCGGANPPVAQAYVNVAITPCPALEDDRDAGACPASTDVLVIPSAALPPPPPGCQIAVDGGADGGTAQITGFDVVPDDPALSTQSLSTCDPAPDPGSLYGTCDALDAGPPAGVVIYKGLYPSKSYKFTIKAYAGTTVIAQALCYATPVADVTVTAMCDPLVPLQ